MFQYNKDCVGGAETPVFFGSWSIFFIAVARQISQVNMNRIKNMNSYQREFIFAWFLKFVERRKINSDNLKKQEKEATIFNYDVNSFPPQHN